MVPRTPRFFAATDGGTVDESLGTFTGQVLSAVIGGAVSLLVALIVVRATRRGNQDLARTQASLAAAENLALIYFDVREAVVKDPPPAELRHELTLWHWPRVRIGT